MLLIKCKEYVFVLQTEKLMGSCWRKHFASLTRTQDLVFSPSVTTHTHTQLLPPAIYNSWPSVGSTTLITK